MLSSLCSALAVLACLAADEPAGLPFCSAAVEETQSEQFARVDGAVIAIELGGKEPEIPRDSSIPFKPNARFKVVEVVKGKARVGTEIEVLYFGVGRLPAGTKFYVTAGGTESLAWDLPLPLSAARLQYLRGLWAPRNEGEDRLPRFLSCLDSPDELIARDAQQEFSRASYQALRALKPRMNHDQVVSAAKDAKGSNLRRRVALAMLGVCGGPEDSPMLERLITSGERDSKLILDALLGAYLVLRGAEGMDFVDRQFLANAAATDEDLWSAMTALRVVDGIRAVPRDRLVRSCRLLLERPKVADLAIPQLAQWEDWESTERVVRVFKECEGGHYVRVSAMRFLITCPKATAKAHLNRLKELDPYAFKSAAGY